MIAVQHLLYLVIILCVHAELELKYVQLIHRHGHRSPHRKLVVKDVSPHIWSNGLNQLTDKGIKEQFELGLWIRNRYGNFLKDSYFQEEIEFMSTDTDRAIMAVQLTMTGLYYNNDEHQIIPGLNWRPIPIDVVRCVDGVFLMPRECIPFNKKINKMYKERFKEFQPTLDTVRRAFNNSKLKFDDLIDIIDNEKFVLSNHMPSSSWVTQELFESMNQIASLMWKKSTLTDEFLKFYSGLSLNAILNKIENFVQKKDSKKFQLISAHGVNIASLLSVLDIYNDMHPPEASCVILELWQISQANPANLRNWIVRVYYKNSSDDSPTNLKISKIKGCDSDPCTLHDFKNFIKPMTLTLADYAKFCSWPLCKNQVNKCLA